MDKSQIKFQFEILGEEVQAIAKKHNLSTSMLNYMIEEEDWKRLPIAETFNTWKYKENPSEELLTQVKEHGALIRTLRTSELDPKIMVVELALLNKVHTMVSLCEKPVELKQLAEVLQILKPVESINGVDEGLKIMVVNQFGDSSGSHGSGVHLSSNSLAVGGDVVDELLTAPSNLEKSDGPNRPIESKQGSEMTKVVIDV